MFDFFKKDKDETVKKTDTFIEIACLLIHASKIDEIYTEEEKKIIKKTLIKLGSKDDEVEEIIKRKINISHINYIGFNEISSFINKEISINEAIEDIFVRTRQYAKRQKKWFNVNNYDISFDLHEISKNDIVDKLIQIN